MKRKPLFRAKDSKRKVWVHGGYSTYRFNEFRQDMGKTKSVIMTEDYGDIVQVDPDTVGEFTNLHDKEQKYLWEKDIVEYYNHDMKIYFIGIICNTYEWDHQYNTGNKCRSAWALVMNNQNILTFDHHFKPSDCRLVGNLIDNPDLIENSESFRILF